MKKLLALILCVMMFVAVIPTSAFAGGTAVDNPLYSAAEYATQIKNMIKNTKSNIENSYKVLAGDQVVYGSAKAMDDMIVGLVDGIGDTLIEKELMKKAGVDAIKDNVRSYIDGAVAKKISENYYKALDKDGKRDPILYAQLVADSIQGALTDKDFQKGYEAVATYWALASLIKDTRDNLKDARKDFAASVDKKFQADFAAKYTALVDEYIDTFGTAALKDANNAVAYAAYEAAIAPAKTTYDTNVAGAKTTRTAAYNAAATTRDTAISNAETAIATAKQTYANDNATLQQMLAAPAGTYTDAQIAAQKAVVANDKSDISSKEAALYTTTASANAQYSKDIAAADKAYNATMQAAASIYDAQILGPQFTLEDSLEDINPWGDVYYYTFPNVGSWN